MPVTHMKDNQDFSRIIMYILNSVQITVFLFLDSTHAGAHTTEVPTSRTWGAVSNHVLWTDAKSYRGSFKRYPVDEHYEDYGIRGN